VRVHKLDGAAIRKPAGYVLYWSQIRIHDCYALDGRDPNPYANILRCAGLHDRPWPKRLVFGTMRYMSLGEMKRKMNGAAYVREIARWEKKA
jgi:deoxyribodipyrimidine photo-lyase